MRNREKQGHPGEKQGKTGTSWEETGRNMEKQGKTGIPDFHVLTQPEPEQHNLPKPIPSLSHDHVHP